MQPVTYLPGSNGGAAIAYCQPVPPGMVWGTAFLMPMPGGYILPYMQPGMQPGVLWQPALQSTTGIAHAGTGVAAAPVMQMQDATLTTDTLGMKQEHACSEEDDSHLSQQTYSISTQQQSGAMLQPGTSTVVRHTKQIPELPRATAQLNKLDQLVAAADAASKQLPTVSQTSATANGAAIGMPWELSRRHSHTVQHSTEDCYDFTIESEDEEQPGMAGPRLLRKPIRPESLKASLAPMVFDDVREVTHKGESLLQVQVHCPYGSFQGQLDLVPDKKPRGPGI